MTARVFPSIHDLPPRASDDSAVDARVGFTFQDHVAAGFCIDMLTDDKMEAVWCESQDDITVIWKDADQCLVEFIQVKNVALNQLWTIAVVCQQEKRKIGSSVLEKSLSCDRCNENVRFRIVTSQDISTELRVLTEDFGSPARDPASAEFQDLCASIRRQFRHEVKSEKGNNCEFWVSSTMWDVRHSKDAVSLSNRDKLNRTLCERGHLLEPPQMDRLYVSLVDRAKSAAEARRRPSGRKLKRDELLVWLGAELKHSNIVSGGKNLRRKMEAGQIEGSVIEAAQAHRIKHRKNLRRGYLEGVNSQELSNEILSVLLKLQVEELGNDGEAFHKRCIATLEAMRLQEYPGVPRQFFYGCMYQIADRCQLEFVRQRAS